jgi:LPXTG-motif cell wall-anchored protein
MTELLIIFSSLMAMAGEGPPGHTHDQTGDLMTVAMVLVGLGIVGGILHFVAKRKK